MAVRYTVQAGPDNDWDVLDNETGEVAPFFERSSADSCADGLNDGTDSKSRWGWLPPGAAKGWL